MNSIKSFLASIAILCVSILYAEDNNTYIKQQVAYEESEKSPYATAFKRNPGSSMLHDRQEYSKHYLCLPLNKNRFHAIFSCVFQRFSLPLWP